MMAHVEGMSRYQRALFATSLDEAVSADHPVRVIDAFVCRLDLVRLGFGKAAAKPTGRPPYHPGDLLKLYLYGYQQQVRSSRRLAREAERNIEVMWLIESVKPCFKTIADFRAAHAEAIVGVCRAFIQFCRSQSLYGGQVVAIDGTKIEAAASPKKVLKPERLKKRLEAIDRKITEYMAALDQADREEEAVEPAPEAVRGALLALRASRHEVQKQAEELAAEGLSQRVIGEPDAKLMRTARHGFKTAYNGQIAVDDKYGLIAVAELTNDGNDHCQLLPIGLSAKQALEAETLTLVADTGYSNGEHGHQCTEAGMLPIVPRPKVTNPEGNELYSRERFTYDKASDSWTCPAGQTLTRTHTDRRLRQWRYGTKACAACPLKSSCTKSASRSILRDFNEDDIQAMHDRATREWMRKRRSLAEAPFGTIKAMMGHPRFLVRGLRKAGAELALLATGFNLKRATALLTVPLLLAALQRAPA